MKKHVCAIVHKTFNGSFFDLNYGYSNEKNSNKKARSG